MKKLVAFALVLSLGLFCAVGCKEEVKKPPKENKPGVENKDKGAKPAGDAAKDAPKPEEKKEMPAMGLNTENRRVLWLT